MNLESRLARLEAQLTETTAVKPSDDSTFQVRDGESMADATARFEQERPGLTPEMRRMNALALRAFAVSAARSIVGPQAATMSDDELREVIAKHKAERARA